MVLLLQCWIYARFVNVWFFVTKNFVAKSVVALVHSCKHMCCFKIWYVFFLNQKHIVCIKGEEYDELKGALGNKNKIEIMMNNAQSHSRVTKRIRERERVEICYNIWIPISQEMRKLFTLINLYQYMFSTDVWHNQSYVGLLVIYYEKQHPIN